MDNGPKYPRATLCLTLIIVALASATIVVVCTDPFLAWYYGR